MAERIHKSMTLAPETIKRLDALANIYKNPHTGDIPHIGAVVDILAEKAMLEEAEKNN